MQNPNKANKTLPPRSYYRLNQAAEMLGCTNDDLVHYGATARLELIVAIRSNEIFALPINRNAGDEGLPFDSPDWLVVPRKALRFVECFDSVECADFYAGYNSILKTGLLQRSTPDSYQGDNKSGWTYQTRENSTYKIAPITITRSSLFVTSDEISRFKHGLPASDEQIHALQEFEKPLPKQKENNLHAVVAALARLYIGNDCSKPYEAAEAILRDFDLSGFDVVKKDALAGYIRAGNERLNQ